MVCCCYVGCCDCPHDATTLASLWKKALSLGNDKNCRNCSACTKKAFIVVVVKSCRGFHEWHYRLSV